MNDKKYSPNDINYLINDLKPLLNELLYYLKYKTSIIIEYS